VSDHILKKHDNFFRQRIFDIRFLIIFNKFWNIFFNTNWFKEFFDSYLGVSFLIKVRFKNREANFKVKRNNFFEIFRVILRVCYKLVKYFKKCFIDNRIFTRHFYLLNDLSHYINKNCVRFCLSLRLDNS
jgi:hypothetical protein